MKPLFNDGEIVPVKLKQRGSEYEVGDVIVFKKGKTYVIHEVFHKFTTSEGVVKYVTRGLNKETNRRVDRGVISSTQILGFADLSNEFATEFDRLMAEGNVPLIKASAETNFEAQLREQIRKMDLQVRRQIYNALGKYLNQHEEGARIGDNKMVEQARNAIDKFTFLKENRFPPTFELFNDEIDLSSITDEERAHREFLNKLDLSSTTEEGRLNREFLLELKKEYEKFPLLFRSKGFPKIVFYDRVTDHPFFQELRKRSDFTNFKEDYSRAEGADGWYYQEKNEIVIAMNLGVRKDSVDSGSIIGHEMGHFFYGIMGVDKIKDEDGSVIWENIYNKIKNNLKNTGDLQASKDKYELFADAFSELFTGIIRGNRLFMNAIRFIGLNNDYINSYGILNDYPEVRDFLIDLFI